MLSAVAIITSCSNLEKIHYPDFEYPPEVISREKITVANDLREKSKTVFQKELQVYHAVPRRKSDDYE